MKLYPKNHEIAQKLQQLKKQLAGAIEIKQGMEVLARTLAEQYVDSEAYELKESLQTNLEHLREIFYRSDDLKIREFIMLP